MTPESEMTLFYSLMNEQGYKILGGLFPAAEYFLDHPNERIRLLIENEKTIVAYLSVEDTRTFFGTNIINYKRLSN